MIFRLFRELTLYLLLLRWCVTSSLYWNYLFALVSWWLGWRNNNCLWPSVGLDDNKLVQAWNITHYFLLSCFRRAVKSTLDRRFLGVRYKCISQCVCVTHIAILIIFLSLAAIFYLSKSQQSTARKIVQFCSVHILCSHIFPCV